MSNYVQPGASNPVPNAQITVGGAPNLNPMGLTNGPGPRYQQAGTAAPPANPVVANYPNGSNPLGITGALPRYIQPMSVADDPSGNIKNGKSGKGGPG